MNIVTRVRTTVPFDVLYDALFSGFQSAVVSTPSSLCIGIAWAMLCHEHGVILNSLWAVFCFNFGNHDATSEDKASGRVFITVPEHEVGPNGDYKAEHVRSAYVDANDGALGYWLRLRSGFAEAFAVMTETDDPRPEEANLDIIDRFALALKRAGYFTDDPAKYAADMRRLMLDFDKRYPETSSV